MRNDRLDVTLARAARLSDQDPGKPENSDCHHHGLKSCNSHSIQEKYDYAKYQSDDYPFKNHSGYSLAIGNRDARRYWISYRTGQT